MKPNPHLPRITRDQMPPQMQKIWDYSMAVTGDATFVEISGNNPAVFDWYMNDFYEKLFYAGRIEKKIVELVRLRLANIHGCAYCNKGDTAQALDAGVSQEQIKSLHTYETGPFSEAEKAALALADVMALTNPNGYLNKDLYDRARKHFTDGQLYELGQIMAVLCGVAKWLFAFDMVEKEDYCPFVPKV